MIANLAWIEPPIVCVPNSMTAKVIGGKLDGVVITVPMHDPPGVLHSDGEEYEIITMGGVGIAIRVLYRHESLTDDEAIKRLISEYEGE